MFVTKTHDQYRFITQPDYAILVGQLARHWGNEAFDQPTSRHSFIIAAEHHDFGWIGYDLRPHIINDSIERLDGTGPAQEDLTEFYERGVTDVAEIDPYAGLLAAMHAAGLCRQNYGIWTETTSTSADPGFEAFVAELERFQRKLLSKLEATSRYAEQIGERDRDLLATLHEHGVPDDMNNSSQLWKHYLLLEFLDDLSVHLCTNQTLDSRTVGPLVNSTDDSIFSEFEESDPATIRLDPYPFDTAPLSVFVAARTVPTSFDSEADLIKAYYQAERYSVEFIFHR
ncbi:DUF3891 family protein [Halocatena halophila]|uniref:DUF3891 family protein n=1 Tax=Halocatena halophila TaxID=2814576 RepID=UPI002ED5068A